jgi:hypothetical protein
MRLSVDPSGVDRHSAALYEQKKRAAELKDVLRQAADLAKGDPLMDYRALERSADLAARLEKSIRDKEELLNMISDKARRCIKDADAILDKWE